MQEAIFAPDPQGASGRPPSTGSRVERDVVAEVRDARRASAQGDREHATRLLGELVGVVDGRSLPALTWRCFQIASSIGAGELALHYALCFFCATRGRRDAFLALTDAAAIVPSLADASARIRTHRGRPEDWLAITAADRHGSWPQIEAFGPTGDHVGLSLDHLRRADRAIGIGAGDPVAWVLPHARLTWAGRAWAVGCSDPTAPSVHRLVAELSDHNCGAALRWFDGEPATDATGRVCLIASRHSFGNYYHWLMEGLVDVLVLDDAGLLRSADRVIVCVVGPVRAYITESLLALGFDLAQFEFPAEPLDLTGVTVIKPMRGALPWPDLVRAPRRRLALDTTNRPRRRLLLSRRDAGDRRVVNEPELEAILASFGFETIMLSRLSFQEQIDAFASAEVVVAPHGAGLTNLVFSEWGTGVVELLVEPFVPSAANARTYRGIADTLDLRYVGLICDVAGDDGQDLRADAGAVAEAVRSMLATDEPDHAGRRVAVEPRAGGPSPDER